MAVIWIQDADGLRRETTKNPRSGFNKSARPAERSCHHVGRDSRGIEGQYPREMAAWLLETEWMYFFTATFREERSIKAVRRSMALFVKDLRPDRFFWATEAGKVTGRNHVHGLLHFEDSACGIASAEMIWNYLSKRFGRSNCREIVPGKGAEAYCSKYVIKGFGDWNAGGKTWNR